LSLDIASTRTITGSLTVLKMDFSGFSSLLIFSIYDLYILTFRYFNQLSNRKKKYSQTCNNTI